MTKRDLIKFLERKMNEKRSAVVSEYNAIRAQERQKIHEELELPALADGMQMLLQQAYDLWDDWQKKHESYEGLTVNPHYYGLIPTLSACTDTEDATMKRLLVENIELKCKALTSIAKESNLAEERVIATFNTVISSVQQMKHTKEAAVYLKELGFDLSELEKPADQVQTALMVPVDTNYLFVKAA